MYRGISSIGAFIALALPLLKPVEVEYFVEFMNCGGACLFFKNLNDCYTHFLYDCLLDSVYLEQSTADFGVSALNGRGGKVKHDTFIGTPYW